ncbi:hypothetical protein IKA92_04410 [bacterium]|nr:hypothetical protein [bacterium]
MSINFKANIKINPNIYQGLNGEELKHIEGLVKDCVDFMEIPKVKKATEGDTLEFSKSTTRGYKNAHNIRLTFNNDAYKEPVEIDFCGFEAKKLKTGMILDQIFLYLHNIKFTIPQRFSSDHEMMRNEVIQELLKLDINA